MPAPIPLTEYIPLHSPWTHSALASIALAGIVALFGFRSRRWVLGAFLGGLTHVLLDGMVHAEMLPFYPLEGNPFYWGGMEPVSLILVPPFVWLTAQYVSATVGCARKSLAARRQAEYSQDV